MKRESQSQRLLRLLSDGKKHNTREILTVVYGSEHHGTARIASRINDLRNLGYQIPEAERDRDDKTVFWYQLGNPPKPKPKLVPMFIEKDGVRMVRLVPSVAQ